MEPLRQACLDAIAAHSQGRFPESKRWWAAHGEAVLDALHRQPEEALSPEVRATLLLAAYWFKGRFGSGIEATLHQQSERLLAADGPLCSDHVLWVVLASLRARHLCVERADLKSAFALFALSERALEAHDPEERVAWLGISLHDFKQLNELRATLLAGDHRLSHARCLELIARLTRHTDAAAPWGHLQELWNVRGIIEQWSQEHDAARASLLTAHLIALERGGGEQACATLAMVAQIHHLDGDLEQAEQVYGEVDRLALAHALSPAEAFPVFVRVVRPFLALERGQLELAMRCAQELVTELSPGDAAIPCQLARAILVIAAVACERETLARAHYQVLCMELRHDPRSPFLALEGLLERLFERRVSIFGNSLKSDDHRVKRSGSNLFLRFTERAVGCVVGQVDSVPAIGYAADGSWLECWGEERVDLRRRHPLRRALLALIQAGEQGLTREALITHAWPDEVIRHDAALTRLRVLVHQLRELGLRGVVLTTETGYRLDQSIPFIASH